MPAAQYLVGAGRKVLFDFGGMVVHDPADEVPGFGLIVFGVALCGPPDYADCGLLGWCWGRSEAVPGVGWSA